MTEPTTDPYSAYILADSISDGVRLVTFQVTFPRFILAEMNTHRVISKNSASSRAIPVKKNIKKVSDNPFIPEAFTKNQRGMQAEEALAEDESLKARMTWLDAKDRAVSAANTLRDLKVHKQHANRILEPFAWHTVLATATELENFFALRCHPDAQPEIQKAARAVRHALANSTPEHLLPGQWHLPLIREEDQSLELTEKIKVSVARCARVSYLTHDGKRDVSKDLELYDRLVTGGHMSPLEHVACVMQDREAPPFSPMWRTRKGSTKFGNELRESDFELEGYFCGNFRAPWLQYRKMVHGEFVFKGQ